MRSDGGFERQNVVRADRTRSEEIEEGVRKYLDHYSDVGGERDGLADEFIREDLNIVEDVLRDMDIVDLLDRVPKCEDVVLRTGSRGSDMIEGSVSPFGHQIEMRIHGRVSWKTFELVLFHETAHVMNSVCLASGPVQGDLPARVVSFGFDRGRIGVADAEKRWEGFPCVGGTEYMWGVTSEPLAEMFMLRCVDYSDGETAVPGRRYWREVAFFVAMFEKMAEVNGTTAKEEFDMMFRASVRGDFGYFKYLQEVFQKVIGDGSKAHDFVSGLNQLRSVGGVEAVVEKTGDDEKIRRGGGLTRMSQLGGFFEGYQEGCGGLGDGGGGVEVSGFKCKFGVVNWSNGK